MNPVVFGIAVPVAFAAGVIFHKYVISEAEKIQSHITGAEQRIRGDVASLLHSAGGAVDRAASTAAAKVG